MSSIKIKTSATVWRKDQRLKPLASELIRYTVRMLPADSLAAAAAVAAVSTRGVCMFLLVFFSFAIIPSRGKWPQKPRMLLLLHISWSSPLFINMKFESISFCVCNEFFRIIFTFWEETIWIGMVFTVHPSLSAVRPIRIVRPRERAVSISNLFVDWIRQWFARANIVCLWFFDRAAASRNAKPWIWSFKNVDDVYNGASRM